MEEATAKSFRVGVLGFGKLGRFIVKQILSSGSEHQLELAFIWNRSSVPNIDTILDDYRTNNDNTNNKIVILDSLDQLSHHCRSVQLVIEVCHPDVVLHHGLSVVRCTNLLIGSPVALMNDQLYEQLLQATSSKRIFVSTGALWGAADIRRLANLSLLQSATIQMKFSPRALRLTNLESNSVDILVEKKDEHEIHYSGTVRQLSKIAPNNVNTMACLALAGLGPDHTKGILISDSKMTGYHQIIVTVSGKPQRGFENVFQNINERLSPTASESNVTSQQTFYSFWYSILQAKEIIESNFGSPGKIDII